MWVVWISLVFAIICASFTNRICERLFLAPTCGVYLLKSLLNSWLVPQFFVCCKQNFTLRLSKLHFLVRACTLTMTVPIRWALSGRCSEAAGFHSLFCPDWMNYLSDRGGLGIGRLGMKARHTATDSLSWPWVQWVVTSKCSGYWLPGSVSRAPKWLWFIVALGGENMSASSLSSS